MGDTPRVLVSTNSRRAVSASVTIGTGQACAAGEIVAPDAGGILEFDMAEFIAAGGSGIILSSLVTLNQNAVFSGGAGYYLYLFNISPTVQAVSTAFDLAAADLAGYIGRLSIGTLVDLGSECAVDDWGHNMDFTLAEGDTKLYGKLVAKGTETTIDGKIINIILGVANL